MMRIGQSTNKVTKGLLAGLGTAARIVFAAQNLQANITGFTAEIIGQIPLGFFTAVGGATTVGVLAALLWRF